MKTLLILLLFTTVISSNAQNEDRVLLKKNKVKSVTTYSEKKEKTHYNEYDINGLLVKEVQEPFFMYKNSKEVTSYVYKDTLIKTRVNNIIINDSIEKSDTTLFEYDWLGRMTSEYHLRSNSSNGFLILYEYSEYSENKLQLLKFYDADTPFCKINCTPLIKNGIEYYLQNYKVYEYDRRSPKSKTIFSYYNSYPDKGRKKDKFFNKSINYIIPFGDTLIQSTKILTNYMDSLNKHEFDCEKIEYPVVGPSIESITLEKYKGSKLIEIITNNMRELEYTSSQKYIYDNKGLLIKLIYEFTQTRNGDLYVKPKLKTSINEFVYEYYK